MKIALLVLLIIAIIVVATIFPTWYLIQIGHAPNWAVAMYIFLTLSINSIGYKTRS